MMRFLGNYRNLIKISLRFQNNNSFSTIVSNIFVEPKDSNMFSKPDDSNIFVEPKNSLTLNSVRIFGNNFKPDSPVTVFASVHSDSENISFSSYAYIITSSSGSFDLNETESLGGTYKGIQPMGLFWSMIHNFNSNSELHFADPSVPLEYYFKVYNSHDCKFIDNNLICKTKVIRNLLAPGVSRKFIKYGRTCGILFCPPGNGPFPAIITLYGGTKQQLPIQDASTIFANNGYVSLALAYFNVGDLPKVCTNIELEYFEEAVVFLQSLSNVNKNSIGVFGISRGGGIALSMASFLPQIKSVASINGCLHSLFGHTTYRGVTIPKLVYNENDFKMKYKTLIAKDVKVALNDPSLIHFEKSKAKMFFAFGMDDNIFDANFYLKILDGKTSLSNSLKVITYGGMGHLVYYPYMPGCVCGPVVHDPQLIFEYGGRNTEAHALSQIKVWKDVVDFFDSTLKI